MSSPSPHAAQQQQKKQSVPSSTASAWPPTLQKFVERALSVCKTPADRQVTEKYLNETINAAKREQALWSTDWGNLPLPPLPSSGSAAKSPGKQKEHLKTKTKEEREKQKQKEKQREMEKQKEYLKAKQREQEMQKLMLEEQQLHELRKQQEKQMQELSNPPPSPPSHDVQQHGAHIQQQQQEFMRQRLQREQQMKEREKQKQEKERQQQQRRLQIEQEERDQQREREELGRGRERDRQRERDERNRQLEQRENQRREQRYREQREREEKERQYREQRFREQRELAIQREKERQHREQQAIEQRQKERECEERERQQQPQQSKWGNDGISATAVSGYIPLAMPNQPGTASSSMQQHQQQFTQQQQFAQRQQQYMYQQPLPQLQKNQLPDIFQNEQKLSKTQMKKLRKQQRKQMQKELALSKKRQHQEVSGQKASKKKKKKQKQIAYASKFVSSQNLSYLLPKQSLETVLGTCTDLEKPYLRLTSQPDPSTVRPLPILKESLKLMKRKYFDEHADYETYICEQLKSIRQDLTVQMIKDEFTVTVYETHARIALQNRDLSEFNQCQSQLKDLYAQGLEGNVPEFSSYRVLYLIFTGAYADLTRYLQDMSSELRRHEYIEHALQVHSALVTGNFYKLLVDLYRSAPNMAPSLMLIFVHKLRKSALKCMLKAYGPTEVPLSLIRSQLGYMDATNNDFVEFMNKTACAVYSEKDPNCISCKQTLISLKRSEEEEEEMEKKEGNFAMARIAERV